jgi:hypothetical protein
MELTFRESVPSSVPVPLPKEQSHDLQSLQASAFQSCRGTIGSCLPVSDSGIAKPVRISRAQIRPRPGNQHCTGPSIPVTLEYGLRKVWRRPLSASAHTFSCAKPLKDFNRS